MIYCKNDFNFQVDLNITDETDTTDTDSVSDSFEDIDASGASEAIAIGNAAAQILHPEIYKKRTDFVNKDDYALYVRTHVQVGMTVKCCRTYEEVHEGTVQVFLQDHKISEIEKKNLVKGQYVKSS